MVLVVVAISFRCIHVFTPVMRLCLYGIILLVTKNLILIQLYLAFFVFFFQAEDGIRDYKVTGVQTCALPIFDAVEVQPPQRAGDDERDPGDERGAAGPDPQRGHDDRLAEDDQREQPVALGDRKSTRLNSSHLVISYAVFCLKKKIYNEYERNI